MRYIVTSALLFFSSFVFASSFTKIKDLTLPPAQYATFMGDDILLVNEYDVQVLRKASGWQVGTTKDGYLVNRGDKNPVQLAVGPFIERENYSGTKVYYEISMNRSTFALANTYEGLTGRVSETAGMVFSASDLSQKTVLKHQLKFKTGELCWFTYCSNKLVSRLPAAVVILSDEKTVGIVYYSRFEKYLKFANFGGIMQSGYMTYGVLSDICYWQVKNGKPKGCVKVNGSPAWDQGFKLGNSAVTSDKSKVVFERTSETSPEGENFSYVDYKLELDIKTGKVSTIKSTLGYALGSSLKLDSKDNITSCSSSWDLELSGKKNDGSEFTKKLGAVGDKTAAYSKCTSVTKIAEDYFGATFVKSYWNSRVDEAHLKVFDSKGLDVLSEVSPHSYDGEQFLDHNFDEHLLMLFKSSSRSNSYAEIWSY